MKDMSIRTWIEKFNNGEFVNGDFKTQCYAGWYDWFCNQSSLANKTQKMGKIVSKIVNGGKVDLNNWYVWFKNNCPVCGPLYDDFRFARLDNGDVQFTIQLDCCWSKHKYSVYGLGADGERHFDNPVFECDNSRDLVKWLNTSW